MHRPSGGHLCAGGPRHLRIFRACRTRLDKTIAVSGVDIGSYFCGQRLLLELWERLPCYADPKRPKLSADPKPRWLSSEREIPLQARVSDGCSAPPLPSFPEGALPAPRTSRTASRFPRPIRITVTQAITAPVSHQKRLQRD